MAQTFKDFLTECDMYEHSKEHYEIMKECSELSLMEQYVEDQRYMATKAALLTEQAVVLTEGFFMESSDNEQILMVESKIASTAAGLWNRISNGFMNTLSRFITFFQKLIGRLDPLNKRALDVRKAMKGGIELTTEEGKELSDIGDKAYKFFAAGSHGDDSLADVVDAIKAPNNSDSERQNIEAAATLILSVTGFTIELVSGVDAIPIETMTKACDRLVKGKKKYNFQEVTNLIENEAKEVNSNGLHLIADTRKITKCLNKLNSLVEQLKNKEDDDTREDRGVMAGGKSNDQSRASSHINEVRQAYAKITKYCSGTIKVYNEYVAVRNKGVALMERIVKNAVGRKPQGGSGSGSGSSSSSGSGSSNDTGASSSGNGSVNS